MQLVLVEAPDQRWLFSDAEPAAVFFYQTELPCPTFSTDRRDAFASYAAA